MAGSDGEIRQGTAGEGRCCVSGQCGRVGQRVNRVDRENAGGRGQGESARRERRLPAPVAVYDVMALALWREAPLEQVLRVACEGMQRLGGGQAGAVHASTSAISQPRTRPEVMRRLAERVRRPLAAPRAPDAWYRGFRVMGPGRRLHGRG